MPKIELKQEVKLFIDEETIGTQRVLIDTEDECGEWVIINHNGNTQSMSCANFEKLIELYQEAKKQI